MAARRAGVTRRDEPAIGSPLGLPRGGPREYTHTHTRCRHDASGEVLSGRKDCYGGTWNRRRIGLLKSPESHQKCAGCSGGVAACHSPVPSWSSNCQWAMIGDLSAAVRAWLGRLGEALSHTPRPWRVRSTPVPGA